MLYLSRLALEVDTFVTLVKREFRIRYRDSFLGYAWVFGAPLLMIATYSFFVFGIARPASISSGTYGIAGLWCCLGFWQWMSESITRATSTFHENAQLVKRTTLNRSLLPLTAFAVSSLGFLIPIAATLGAMAYGGAGMGHAGHLLLGLVTAMPWVLGAIYVSSTLGTFVRDAKYAVPICMNVGMFLSPVLYGVDDAPGLIRPLLALNPLSQHLSHMKQAASAGETSISAALVASTAAGAAFLALSYTLFMRRSREFPDVL